MTYIFSELINRVNLCAAEQFTDERRILTVFVIPDHLFVIHFCIVSIPLAFSTQKDVHKS